MWAGFGAGGGAHLGPWWESLQLSRSAEAAVVFQFVLQLVFEDHELQTTPVAVEALVHLRHGDGGVRGVCGGGAARTCGGF